VAEEIQLFLSFKANFKKYTIGGTKVKKRILTALLTCSLALTTVGTPSVVLAEDFDTQIENKEKEIDSLQNQQNDVQEQISSLEEEIATINANVDELKAKQDQLNEDTMQLQEEIADLKVRISKRQDKMAEQARDVQVNGQSTNVVDAVINADSVTDAIGRVYAMNTIVNANNDLV